MFNMIPLYLSAISFPHSNWGLIKHIISIFIFSLYIFSIILDKDIKDTSQVIISRLPKYLELKSLKFIFKNNKILGLFIKL